jgi:hypothetical protein
LGISIQDEAQLNEYPRFANQGVGDFIFRDVDENGILDLDDRTKLGNSIPSFIYGFNLSAELAGFRLSMDFQGQYGKPDIQSESNRGDSVSTIME